METICDNSNEHFSLFFEFFSTFFRIFPAHFFIRIPFFSEWKQFVTIQMSKWLDMATNWTLYSDPSKLLVIHYENVRNDLQSVLRQISQFFNLPLSQNRLNCVLKHKNGLFHREPKKSPNLVPFSQEFRTEMDQIIDYVNDKILKVKGYDSMPTYLYNFYKKTDEEILADIQRFSMNLNI